MANNKWFGVLKSVASVALALLSSEQQKKSSSGSGPSSRKSGSHSGKRNSNGSSSNGSAPRSPRSTAQTKSTRSPESPASSSNSSRAGTTKRSSSTRATGSSAPSSPSRSRAGSRSPALSAQYPGDFRGKVVPEYAPELDGDADPGEIVWTWVPYEEDFSQGKDRPILVIGHDGEWLLGLMLTSKNKDGARYGEWYDVGPGPWDSQGRDSEIRLDRIIRVDPGAMRREGAIMDRTTFDSVIAAMN